ncbi:RHS repeat domain-containing protein [Caenimonas koreensis]|uniref:RHS repeat domain-containing protein n=1 Tax=Caenimonas koreensis TaxID=367474 RepID=UPI0037848D23
MDSDSNRLLGFTQTLTTMSNGKVKSVVTAPVNYIVNANGSMTSDGLREFDYDAANRLAKVTVSKDGEAARVVYLTNAMGQRVFKSVTQAEQTLPDETTLDAGFIAWLMKSFGWLFTTPTTTGAGLGTAYVYGDGPIPAWAMLGEYDNGSAVGKGRTEYIWLPTQDGQALPVGMYRNGKFYAVHADHLGTPRLITDEANKPVWQWPYSAFGNNTPTGVLQATPNPKQAITNQPVLLKASKPIEMNLRFPGQYFDAETGLFYNWNRYYSDKGGRYIQSDPIGLDGGMNRFGYVEGNPLGLFDAEGLAPTKGLIWLVRICKTGIKKIRPVSPEEAVQLAKQGKDLQSNRSTIKKIVNAASEGRGPIKDKAHPDRVTGSLEGRKPHYHPNPRNGSHLFYSMAAAVTLAGQVECDDCTLGYIAEGLDFFNPLSLPKDLMDLTGIGAPN